MVSSNLYLVSDDYQASVSISLMPKLLRVPELAKNALIGLAAFCIYESNSLQKEHVLPQHAQTCDSHL